MVIIGMKDFNLEEAVVASICHVMIVILVIALMKLLEVS